MRRKEFKVNQEEEIEDFLAEMSFGFLGTLTAEGGCRVTPLNFAYGNGVFYFHGSLAGEKMKQMKADNRISFTVAKEYALIPSYWSDPDLACPATSYFKSVMAEGIYEKVDDPAEKAEALSLFMRKLQPEGGYASIDAEDERYKGQLKAVAVFKLVPSGLTAKFKFGQNLQEGERAQVLNGLKSRGGAYDADTAELMQKYCPFHTEK
ncbi:pyridoxamine 5'-phosphate oxidase family protein [Paenibacillus physcomitrellae]|uniref:Transcriptional regulator n=1 Tax=Paenibacillus physcomitrellae TaxID=1619311 RepID=A0ABQ1G329_9BACL|nr:pyridoxamine 5'-phosphate oxidase family protein [Paenibacillus physcomitrellae]GGA35728.1 transcriptional regulator [Paenibacillus physcomitrellae]